MSLNIIIYHPSFLYVLFLSPSPSSLSDLKLSLNTLILMAKIDIVDICLFK
jgi:hypothetical protein